MLFQSNLFLFLFLPITLLTFHLLKKKNGIWAIISLIVSSLVFYCWWNVLLVGVLIGSVLTNYVLSKILIKNKSSAILIIGIILNLLLLFYFKYFNFFISNLNEIFRFSYSISEIILPLGISFFTFQQISFLCDAKDNKVSNFNFIDYLFLVTFFPHLIAGPIVYQNEIFPQLAKLKSREKILIQEFSLGLLLFLIGLIKKTIIADHLSLFTTPFFDTHDWAIQPLGALTSWATCIAYTLEIYFDFSGYSDMAIGIALMFGVTFLPNFSSPLKSVSIIDFWQSWHISMTKFFMHYFYTPLNMYIARYRLEKSLSISASSLRTFDGFISLILLPTIITMTIIGLWHGGDIKFIVFGILNGIFLVINHFWRQVRIFRYKNLGRNTKDNSWLTTLYWALTFGSFTFSLIYFRAPSLTVANAVVDSLFSLPNLDLLKINFNYLNPLTHKLNPPHFTLEFFSSLYFWELYALLISLIFPSSHKIIISLESKIKNLNNIYFYAILYFLLGMIFICIFPFMAHYDTKPFIYFQF